MEVRPLTQAFERISVDPAIMGGKPCVRGTRVTVGAVVEQLGAGLSVEDVPADYPYLTRADIVEALRFGAHLARELPVETPPAS